VPVPRVTIGKAFLQQLPPERFCKAPGALATVVVIILETNSVVKEFAAYSIGLDGARNKRH
jgi:hypothetical protein